MYKGDMETKGNAMSYESQMIKALEARLATKVYHMQACLDLGHDASDHVKEVKRIERQLAKYRKES